MTIIIEDTGQYIDCGDFEIQITSPANFQTLLKKVLTPKQYINYIGYDTHRRFIISNKRFTHLENIFNEQKKP